MTTFPALVPVWAAAVTAVVLGLDVLSRRWRRHDGALWHQVWLGCILATAAGMIVTGLLPVSVTWTSDVVPAWAGPAGPPALWFEKTGTAWAAAIAAISGVLLLRLAAGWARVRRLARLAQPAFSPHAARWVSLAAGDVEWQSAQFRVHRRVRTPVTIGWRQPIILLPEAWPAWPAERLGVIVRHELAHVARRDYFWNLVAASAEAALWFVPGIWMATRRVRLSAELAADQAAAAPVGRLVYARHLVDTAAGLEPHGRFARFSVALGVTTDLQRRVDSLLDDRDRPPAAGRVVRALVVGAAIVVVLGAMVVRATPAQLRHTPVDHAQIHAQKHQH